MNTPIVTSLLWVSAIGAGLIAGMFFTFSTFVMTALDRSGQVHGILAMNSVNTTILQSLFMPVFYVSTLTSIALAVIALMRWEGSRTMAVLIAAIVYVLGMFVCTIVFNVPLNNALAAVVDPASAEGTSVWARFMKEWTFWNHVRTVASLIATVLFTFALRSPA